MSDKYIIKNCPCYNKDYSCQSKDNITGKYCQDCTDCVLKRIVELCQGEINGDWYKANAYYAMGRVAIAEKILSRLDIQEVE